VKLLSLLHRWTGGLIGLLLAVIGLSGAILVWEGSWVSIPGESDPLVERPQQIAVIAERAAAEGTGARITFASDEVGLHQIVWPDGRGAYARQDGAIVDRWTSEWQRPELWLFDLHHHLFAGHDGETVTGIAGIAGILFVVTGLVLWWRGRASFRPTLLPRRLQPGPITKHHRDLGVLAAPILLLSMITGVLMLFAPLREAAIGREARPKAEAPSAAPAGPAEAVIRAKALFPGATLRRIVLPKEPGGAIVVRLRQPFEWTPQGRTQVSFAANGAMTVEDAALANGPAAAAEKLYPIHSAKAGGFAMKLLMTFSGVSLFILGSLATYAFWLRRWVKRRKRSGTNAPHPASAAQRH
jgi:uncharacterized iron-regulated membrane protein